MNLLIESRNTITSTLYVAISVALFTAFGFFGFAGAAHAQTDALKINVIPQYPAPFQTVDISLENYSQDLNRVNISWSINGKVVEQGTGLTRFQTNVGALGSVSTLSINMGGLVHSVVLRPSATDLVWQADSYTPPFYKGKALHSSQDPLTIVAEPFIMNNSGTRLDPEKLVYRWKQNGQVVLDASGYGKKVFKTNTSILPKPLAVEVEVSSVDEAYRSMAQIVIPESRPQVALYENHPLYGINFNTAINDKNFQLMNAELNIVATPFFFSNKQRNSNFLSYDWTLNNSTLSQQGNEVTFRKPEGTRAGKSLVSLAVKNLERFMQSADASTYVEFSEQNTF